MSESELIEWLEAAGARLVYRDGHRTLRTPQGAPVPDDEVRSAIAEHADAIDHHFEAAFESRTCGECERGVHTADGDAIFAVCGNLFCPAWREGLGPAWFAGARSYAVWKRDRDRAEAARLEGEAIPE